MRRRFGSGLRGDAVDLGRQVRGGRGGAVEQVGDAGALAQAGGPVAGFGVELALAEHHANAFADLGERRQILALARHFGLQLAAVVGGDLVVVDEDPRRQAFVDVGEHPQLEVDGAAQLLARGAHRQQLGVERGGAAMGRLDPVELGLDRGGWRRRHAVAVDVVGAQPFVDELVEHRAEVAGGPARPGEAEGERAGEVRLENRIFVDHCHDAVDADQALRRGRGRRDERAEGGAGAQERGEEGRQQAVAGAAIHGGMVARYPRRMERYELEPYTRAIAVELIGSGASPAGAPAPAPFYADVAETLLFPGGGGQPADRGLFGGSRVVAEEKQPGGGWRLFLEAPPEAGQARLELDWERRYDLMQQHTAQHLLTSIALDQFGWATTAFHLGDELTDIELDATHLPAEKLKELEAKVAEAVRAAVPIRCLRVEKEAYATMPGVRSRGLPAGHQGSVRLVEIEGYDLNTCGGTHLRSTAEIEMLKLLHTEPMRGGTRLHWVAGGRVRQRLEAAEERTAKLRRLLDTGDQEMPAIVEAKLEQLAELRRQKEKIEARLAEAEAAACGDQIFAERHCEEADLPYLQKIARHWQNGSSPGLLFLTAGKGKEAAFLLASRGELQLDLKKLGQEVAAALEGKGGGAGRLFQGKASSLEDRAGVVARLRQGATE